MNTNEILPTSKKERNRKKKNCPEESIQQERSQEKEEARIWETDCQNCFSCRKF